MNILIIQQLIERLSSLLRSESRHRLAEFGLQPIQFDALCYLVSCNRYSDTPKAVTEFLGLTKGTVSQSIKILESKGLVLKTADKLDKRVTHLSVSEQGKKLVESLIPAELLKLVSEHSSKDDMRATADLLGSLLRQVQDVNGFKSFGQCQTCHHNHTKGDGHYYCGLTKERLSNPDILLICVEHKMQ
ncbi:winged helix-turn-helix transcriptional regulator [Shewanella sp. VB17]|uniref:MarR family winged helix-turn-helix transcriptional regulator n=1 Tax=Shewanella sp. VB17 TaxID=2739432 RepID=UPI00156398FF|nr:MarR family winged helix-turn-helix transcriptional regulator [Shewanella sp. VB17]NRD73376.1 winged helix-turn-helix transcriptional regulator [Shewanella sp. VB17]